MGDGMRELINEFKNINENEDLTKFTIKELQEYEREARAEDDEYQLSLISKEWDRREKLTKANNKPRPSYFRGNTGMDKSLPVGDR